MLFIKNEICAAALAVMVGSAVVLAGCTGFQPVYSGTLAQTPSLNIAYAEPASRIEQVIYDRLRLTLGETATPDSADRVALSVSRTIGARGLTNRTGQSDLNLLTLTARLTITPAGGGPARVLTRTASAEYIAVAQPLGVQEAVLDAEERAAGSLAESLRLAVLATLSR